MSDMLDEPSEEKFQVTCQVSAFLQKVPFVEVVNQFIALWKLCVYIWVLENQASIESLQEYVEDVLLHVSCHEGSLKRGLDDESPDLQIVVGLNPAVNDEQPGFEVQ